MFFKIKTNLIFKSKILYPETPLNLLQINKLQPKF